MEIREQDLLQNIHNSLKWKLGCSNFRIKLEQVFRVLAGSVCLSLFEAAHKGGKRAFPQMKWDLTQSVSIFTFGTCWLGVVSSKQSDGWVDVPRA